MADWSQLPRDLLYFISKHLESSVDLIRFRSVCSSWRSASIPNSPRLPDAFQVLPTGGLGLPSVFRFQLSRRTVYLIESLERHSGTDTIAWLMKVVHDNHDEMTLLDPIARDRYNNLDDDFPRTLDLSRFRVRELGKEFVLRHLNDSSSVSASLYLEKVVVKALDAEKEGGHVFLTVHVSGKLAIYRPGGAEWTVINDMPSPYDDVTLFKGEFYAVDNNGRTVVVDLLTSTLKLVANPVFGGDKKYLIESCGELLLVDVYLSIEVDEGGPVFVEEYFEYLACYMNERTVRFKVFRLNRADEMWVEFNDLGDRVLFIGDDCTFSASARDLVSSCKGNCILFTENFLNGEEDSRGISVFDIETGSIGPLDKYPELSKLFWPPPSWIFS